MKSSTTLDTKEVNKSMVNSDLVLPISDRLKRKLNTALNSKEVYMLSLNQIFKMV